MVSCEFNSHWRQFYFLLKPVKTPWCQFYAEMSDLRFLHFSWGDGYTQTLMQRNLFELFVPITSRDAKCNVFTPVCHSVHKGVSSSRHPPGQTTSRADTPRQTATVADGTHPTRMHSRQKLNFLFSFKVHSLLLPSNSPSLCGQWYKNRISNNSLFKAQLFYKQPEKLYFGAGIHNKSRTTESHENSWKWATLCGDTSKKARIYLHPPLDKRSVRDVRSFWIHECYHNCKTQTQFVPDVRLSVWSFYDAVFWQYQQLGCTGSLLRINLNRPF